MRERPLSPHLSIYRFRYSLTSSIANRLTGLTLSGGFLLFIGWLVAAAGGAGSYESVRAAGAHPLGRAVLALVVIALVYHTLAGVRHLVWDLGYGLERAQSRGSAWLLGIATLLVSAPLVYLLFARGGAA